MIANLKNELAELIIKKTTEENKIKELTEKIESSDQRLGRISEKMEKYKAEIKKLQACYKKAEEELQSYGDYIEHAKNSVSTLENNIKQYDMGICGLSTTIASLEAINKNAEQESDIEVKEPAKELDDNSDIQVEEIEEETSEKEEETSEKTEDSLYAFGPEPTYSFTFDENPHTENEPAVNDDVNNSSSENVKETEYDIENNFGSSLTVAEEEPKEDSTDEKQDLMPMVVMPMVESTIVYILKDMGIINDKNKNMSLKEIYEDEVDVTQYQTLLKEIQKNCGCTLLEARKYANSILV